MNKITVLPNVLIMKFDKFKIQNNFAVNTSGIDLKFPPTVDLTKYADSSALQLGHSA